MNTSAAHDKKLIVILPIYNGSRYLKEAIDSVLMQDCDNWELLIVDDCSLDNGIEIATSFHKEKIYIRKNEKNIGLYESLNKAIQTIDTDYFVILMQDDLLKAKHISSLLNYAKENEECVSIWGDIDSNGKLLSRGRDNGTLDYCMPSREAWLNTFKRGC